MKQILIAAVFATLFVGCEEKKNVTQAEKVKVGVEVNDRG